MLSLNEKAFMLNLFILATLSLFHFVNVPVATMRESSEDLSEVVSQAYYSEQVNILKTSPGWIEIETQMDHYRGWIKEGQLASRKDKFLLESGVNVSVSRCGAHLYHVPDTIYGPTLTLPFDAQLEVIDEQDKRWIKVATVDGQQGFIQRGDIILNKDLMNRDQIPSFSLQFLGLPYTWGGRSGFGYDCSGFVQMLYRQIGIYLPRDSKDQIRWEGFDAVTQEDLSSGDLVFFGLDENTIQHVGMYIGSDQFIHATVAENAPYIHVSRLSEPEWKGSGKWQYRAFRTLKENIL